MTKAEQALIDVVVMHCERMKKAGYCRTIPIVIPLQMKKYVTAYMLSDNICPLYGIVSNDGYFTTVIGTLYESKIQ